MVEWRVVLMASEEVVWWEILRVGLSAEKKDAILAARLVFYWVGVTVGSKVD